MIEKIEERLVYDDPNNPWVKLFFDKVRFPNGNEGYYNRIVEKDGIPGVVIIPIKDDDIGLVRLFRYPISEWSLELPRGFGEEGSIKQNAMRELHEETGISLREEELKILGELAPNSGIIDSKVSIFWADCTNYSSRTVPQSDEIDAFKWYSSRDVIKRILNGQIIDAVTISALFLAYLNDRLAF